MSTIAQVHAREIIDSRGNPTVEADVILASGALGRAAGRQPWFDGSSQQLERGRGCGGAGRRLECRQLERERVHVAHE